MLDRTHPALKARCRGSKTLSTKVDDETDSFLERQADRSGVPKSEVVRRLLDYYRERREEINQQVDL